MADILSKLDRLIKLTIDMKNIDYKELITDLRCDIVDLRNELSELKEENQKLKSNARSKMSTDGLQEIFEYKDNVCILKEDARGFSAGTVFCPRCYRMDEQLMPLNEVTIMFQNFGKYKCPECKERF